MLRTLFTAIPVRFAGVVLAYLALVVISRAASPAEFGTYAFLLALAMLLASPARLGLRRYLTREWSAGRGEASELRRWAYGTIARGALIVALVPVLVATLRFGDLVLGVVIFGAAILIALNAVQTAALYAARRPIAGQICELIARNLAVVTLASSVVLITGGDLSARAAIAVFATASALALAISIGTRRALLSGLPEGHDSTKQTAASTSGRYRAVIALSAAAGIQMLATQVDLLALGFLRPIEETGYYRLAAQLAGLAAVPLAAATTYAEPRFSKWLHGGNTTAAVMLLKRGATALAAVSGAIAVMVVTFGADLVFFLFGPAYAPAAEPLGLLAVNAWAACSFGLVMTLAMSAGLERKLASAAAIALAANVVLSLIAIPHFAMQGAAAATLASTVLLRILAFRLITREMGKS